jgi:S1-C subfamily serine protease
MVRIVLQGARTGGPIVRAWLGVDDQTVTSEIAQAAGLDHPRGVLVKEVEPHGPAAAAGVHVGDVIVSIAGHEVDDPEALRFRIATLSVGSTTTLRLWHANSERDVTVKVTAPPEEPPRDQQSISGRNPLSGATVANLNPALADELGLDTNQHGVIVTDVKSGSTAERVGVAKGDVVIALNRRTIGTVTDLRQAVAGNSDNWTLSIRRGGRVLSVTVRG